MRYFSSLARSLGGKAFCFVSPARCAGSSFTYAERYAAQAHGVWA